MHLTTGRRCQRFRFASLRAASAAVLAAVTVASAAQAQDLPTLEVRKTDDFEVNGRGGAAAWSKAEWIPLQRRPGGTHDYQTRLKILYSQTGIYLLMDATDQRLTATMVEDFQNLWTEDVFEAFFWTDEDYPVYFEYEISPLNYELPILIPNFDGQFLGWRPWHYDEKRTRKAVAVRGGPQESGATIDGWSAEVFFPYALFQPLRNVPPESGMRWRANFYRVDHDGGRSTSWDWARVGRSFHEFRSYGTLVFE